MRRGGVVGGVLGRAVLLSCGLFGRALTCDVVCAICAG